jgi:hypothetical protein
MVEREAEKSWYSNIEQKAKEWEGRALLCRCLTVLFE